MHFACSVFLDHVLMPTQVVSSSTFSTNPLEHIIRQMVPKGKVALEDIKQFVDKVPPKGTTGAEQRISATIYCNINLAQSISIQSSNDE